MAVTVNNDACDRCGTCIAVCPSNALLLLTRELVVDKELCTQCGACVRICPFGAMDIHDNR